MTPAFEKFVKNPFTGRLITFDPGETTGVSIWDNQQLVDCTQLRTKTVVEALPVMERFFDTYALRRQWNVVVVMEEYRIYGWKTEQHAWQTVHTIQFIGCIMTLCLQREIPFVFQGAGIAKKFCTDEKLKDWGFYERGQRHARDAIRHGAYYLCFGKPRA